VGHDDSNAPLLCFYGVQQFHVHKDQEALCKLLASSLAKTLGNKKACGMCAMVQVGLLVQNLVTFAAAYLIAFSSGWKMTLVVTASIPLMVIAGGIQASVMTGFTSKVPSPMPSSHPLHR
jgi:ABC-type multidrug transport system fused ATPase/permease subunit